MLDKTSEQEVKAVKSPAVIRPLKMLEAKWRFVGTAPYVANKFSEESKRQMMAKQMQGSRSSKERGKREAKVFDHTALVHYSTEGWPGVPCSSIRSAAISACRLVGFKMTLAKLALFVLPEGFDRDESTPLCKLEGTLERRDLAVTLATGATDICARPFFWPWEMMVQLQWDADLFDTMDVQALLVRVGQQVGIGSGRPDSKNSSGQGWGTFHVMKQKT